MSRCAPTAAIPVSWQERQVSRGGLDQQALARIVKRCQDLTGYELFQYIDAAGEIRNMTSEDVNDYLRAIAGEEFSAKDFRTWAGTTLAAKILQRLDEDDNEEPTESALVKAIDEVAAALGNTRAVCRKYYVHPASWMPICMARSRSRSPANRPPPPNWFKLRRGRVLRLLKRRSAAG